jgi:metallo-beta-lactamase family protein
MYLSKKHGKEYKPLFTEDDVEKVLYNTIEYKYNEKFKINDYMWIEFIPAGHIYLSAQIILYIEDNNFKRKILF